MSTFERERECVGPGWRPIVDALNAAILGIAPDYEVLQIKEKFGGLRYYIGLIEDEDARNRVEELIREAEEKADRTCENCGEPGEPKGPGWIRTLCPTCRGER